MPRLMRGVARTAVIAGTATAVSNRVSRRQANRWSQQEAAQYAPEPNYAPEPQYAPHPEYAPPPASSGLPVDELKQLAALREQGILTDEEFAAQKAKLLGG